MNHSEFSTIYVLTKKVNKEPSPSFDSNTETEPNFLPSLSLIESWKQPVFHLM